MRFNDRINFVKVMGEVYDPVEGIYIEGNKTTVRRPCKISTLGTQRTQELFGDIKRQIQVVILQKPYDADFDYVLLANKKYEVKRQSDYRKGVLFLESVSNG